MISLRSRISRSLTGVTVGQSSGLPQRMAEAKSDTHLETTEQMRRFRVLVVSPRFLPDLGGVETHIFETARRMSKREDLELTVLTTDRSGDLPAREVFDGFTVLRCRSYPRRRDYYFAPRLKDLILEGNYDLIHCQGIHTAVPILAMLTARKAGIPYVVTFHTGGHSSSLRHRLRSNHWRVLGPLLRDAAVLVAVSRFEQKLFEKACRLDTSRFKIVRNGGDLPTARAESTPIPGRIVSSGRLERYKGHHRVIEALPIVQRSIPNASLHILGSGPYETKLRILIRTLRLEDSVTIECIPPDDRSGMAEALGSAAVLTAFSEYEAHPVAVMEALMLGIPVVGSATTGIGDLVEDGLITGVPVNAPSAAIAQTLITVLNNHCVTGSASLPTWDNAAEALVHIYRDVVHAAPTLLRSGRA